MNSGRWYTPRGQPRVIRHGRGGQPLAQFAGLSLVRNPLKTWNENVLPYWVHRKWCWRGTSQVLSLRVKQLKAMRRSLPWVQKCKLVMKTCLPNIKLLDNPPTKKEAAQLAPEFPIAVNLAPMPGGSVLQGVCVVSNSLLPQVVFASTPGPLHLEEITSL